MSNAPLEAIETASLDELQSLQLERMRWSLQHAYDNVPHYKKSFDDAGVEPGDLKSLSDLAKFPFTVKTDLRNNYPFGMFAVPQKDVVRIHASSGTTGQPTVVGYSAKDIDTWATVGSCAQIGKNCHLSGGVGIGGVLEPLQANPVIIEDNCFVGARAEIAEGVIVGKGSVLSMGVYIGASTRIFDRATGEIHYGKVPEYSVIVPGSMPSKNNPEGPSLYCVVIVKKVDEKTRSKTSINDLLRD